MWVITFTNVGDSRPYLTHSVRGSAYRCADEVWKYAPNARLVGFEFNRVRLKDDGLIILCTLSV